MEGELTRRTHYAKTVGGRATCQSTGGSRQVQELGHASRGILAPCCHRRHFVGSLGLAVFVRGQLCS